jgi:protein-L-isoaspartate(D-aspartate) O-methyltransferase
MPVTPPDLNDARERMVARQLAARDIRDRRVLDAMRDVPRHVFVATEQAAEAYADYPLYIGHGQTISQPYIVAYMVEQLRLTPESRVLEIGTGCGYHTAVLARVAAHVYSVEIVDALARRARATLDELGITNVMITVRDGTKGWPEHAPYDAITVAAATHEVPPALVEQLEVGGRLIIPLGEEEFQTLRLVTKQAHGVVDEALVDVRFVPLVQNRHS